MAYTTPVDEISVAGAIIGVVGAIASSISSTNMFWTRGGERKVNALAAGDPHADETQKAQDSLKTRGRVKDFLSLLGTAAMVVGAGWAFAPLTPWF